MSVAANIEVVIDGIKTALSRDDWDAVERLGERVRMLVIDAVADGDHQGLSDAASRLDVARTTMPAVPGNRQDRASWALLSDATLAKLAARRVAAVHAEVGDVDRSARKRILDALLAAHGGQSVGAIAEQARIARETASRLLGDLTREGLVRIRKVGRASLCSLTAKGRGRVDG